MKKTTVIIISIISIFFAGQNIFAEISPKCFDAKFRKEAADIVILGEVTDIVFYARKDPKEEKYWTQYDNMTHTKIKVDKYIKGNGPSEITVLTFCLGNGVCVEDQPRFKKGQKGYLYLSKEKRVGKDLYWSVCGSGMEKEYKGGK